MRTRSSTWQPHSNRWPGEQRSRSPSLIHPFLDRSSYLQVGHCRVRREDEYFVSRQLYPNIDFYSGLIYKAIGFPTDYFPVLFTMGRMAGWLAHVRGGL